MNNYQEYFETDIQWIGKIPTHWRLSKIGRHFKLERGRVISNLEIENNIGKYPVYSSQTKNNGELGSIITYDFDGEYVSWTTDGANAGTCFYRKGKFNVTNVCGLISSFDIEIDYNYLSFFLNLGTKIFVRKDINPKLMNDMMSEIPILIVPIKEQKLISQYLDNKTSKIDSLIKNIEKKIELLNEQKTSLIHQYVTKGRDSSVEFKDSGVDWIGDIPKNWDIFSMKFCSDITRGKFTHRPRNDPDYYDGNYPFIQTGDISRSGKFLTSYNQTLNEKGFSVSKEFPIGTLIMGISANIGDVSILKIVSCFPDSIVGFEPKENWNSEFLYYLFSSMKDEFERNSIVSTQLNLNVDRLGDIKIPKVPLKEQVKIVEILDKKVENYNLLIIKENKKINLLSEYRQSLISSVVTGKIRIKEDMI